jgi:hypothetical protein
MRRAIPALLLCYACVSPALAINDEEILRDFPFNLTNPGARALAVRRGVHLAGQRTLSSGYHISIPYRPRGRRKVTSRSGCVRKCDLPGARVSVVCESGEPKR